MISRLLILSRIHRDLLVGFELERAKNFSLQRDNDQLQADLKFQTEQRILDQQRYADFLGMAGWGTSIHQILQMPPREDRQPEEFPRKRHAGDVAREEDAKFEAMMMELMRHKPPGRAE